MYQYCSVQKYEGEDWKSVNYVNKIKRQYRLYTPQYLILWIYKIDIQGLILNEMVGMVALVSVQ